MLPGGERRCQPVAQRHPRQVEGDVDRGRDRQQGDARPPDREAPAPARTEPPIRGGCGRIEQRRRVVRRGRRRERPEAEPAREPEAACSERGKAEAAEREREGRGAEMERDGRQGNERADPGGACHGDLDLLRGPRDRMEHRHHGGDQGEGDHDREKGEVATRGVAGGHRDGHVPEHGRDDRETQHHHHAPERRPDEDQEADRPDRVEGDPLRGEAKAQQDADERHTDPECSAPLPGARPDRREQGDRRDDEERRVRVVHRDPLLDEEHPVEQAEDPREDRHRPAAEEDSGQQEEQPGHERARDHARESPRERVLADVDRGGLAIAAEHEQLLAVRRRLIDVDVRRPAWRARTAGARRRRRCSRVAPPRRRSSRCRPACGRERARSGSHRRR